MLIPYWDSLSGNELDVNPEKIWLLHLERSPVVQLAFALKSFVLSQIWFEALVWTWEQLLSPGPAADEPAFRPKNITPLLLLSCSLSEFAVKTELWHLLGRTIQKVWRLLRPPIQRRKKKLVRTSCCQIKTHIIVFFDCLLQRSFTLIVPQHHLVGFLRNHRQLLHICQWRKIWALTSQNRPTSSAVELPLGLAIPHAPPHDPTGQCKQPDWEHVDGSVASTSACVCFSWYTTSPLKPWMTVLYNMCSC